MNLGILGGSFDPIHNGHLYMAVEAYKAASLDRVLLIPAGHSPNKDESQMTPSAMRYRMCCLAAKSYDWLAADPIEVESGERSYTYRTLEKLRGIYPDDRLFFIMGGDSLDYFDQWVHPERIASCATILVIARDSYEKERLAEKIEQIGKSFPADICIVPCSKYPVSSTKIREGIQQGLDVSAYVPRSVLQYIKENRLYS